MLERLQQLHRQLAEARQGNCARCRCFHNDVLAEVLPMAQRLQDSAAQAICSDFLAWQREAETRSDLVG